MNLTLAKSLYVWARGNPDNQQLLYDWLNASVLEIANGNGQTVANTMANGVSVGFNTSGMSIADWFTTVTQAIGYLEKAPVSKVVGIFR